MSTHLATFAEQQSGRAGGPAVLVSAHRGGAKSYRTQENSLAAFGAAATSGVDLVEFDVHATRDGEFVVSHDPQVVVDGELRSIGTCTYAELSALAAPLPTVAQVCELIPAPVVAHVDVKSMTAGGNGDMWPEAALAQLVHDALGPNRYIFTSTNIVTTRRLAGWCEASGVANCVGLSMWKPLSRGGRLGRVPVAQLLPMARFRRSGAGFVVVHYWLARAGVLAWAHRNGIQTLVWTCDTDWALRTFLSAARVWAVTSNDPARALALR